MLCVNRRRVCGLASSGQVCVPMLFVQATGGLVAEGRCQGRGKCGKAAGYCPHLKSMQKYCKDNKMKNISLHLVQRYSIGFILLATCNEVWCSKKNYLLL